MIYRAIGIMSGSSLDGLDIAFVEFDEQGGQWNYQVVAASCEPYPQEWRERLRTATALSALDYLVLHSDYGHYIGQKVNAFIEKNNLHHQVQLIASHGHTVFHMPNKLMTAQLGNGAAIAAETGINVVSDLRAVDIAFGGQGAPIVPVGEKLLLGEYRFLLNLGGIANLSVNNGHGYTAFDIAPANRIFDLLAQQQGQAYDKDGAIAAQGNANMALLQQLQALSYFSQPHPKSLDNGFGLNEVYPIIAAAKRSTADAMRTYCELLAEQVANSCRTFAPATHHQQAEKLLVTGGGAHNTFFINLLQQKLQPLNIEIVVPGSQLVNYKEALVMALLGILRWREEYNVLSSVTGATRNSINGAVWIGQEA